MYYRETRTWESIIGRRGQGKVLYGEEDRGGCCRETRTGECIIGRRGHGKVL